MKVVGIDEKKLMDAGFEYTRHGYKKEIPNCFRFCYDLYILPKDIYGTITGKMGSDDVLDYEDWIDAMAFRSPECAEETKKLVDELIAAKAITVEVEN